MNITRDFAVKGAWLVFFFVLGFGIFSAWGTRIGWHPEVWSMEGANRAVDQARESCVLYEDNRPKLTVCMREQFVSQIPFWGMNKLGLALERAITPLPLDEMLVSRCHDITHALGQAGNRRNQPIYEILSSCTETCQSGCYHGAIEGFIAKGNSIDAIVTDDICEKSRLEGQRKNECYHGLGHAIGYATVYSLNRSLDYCNQVSVGEREMCGLGVFMELFEAVSPASSTPQLPENHPQWCRKMAHPYDKVCFTRSGVYTYNQFQDMKMSIDVCRQSPMQYQYSCLLDLGKYVIVPHTQDPKRVEEAVDYCREYMNADGVDTCMQDIFIQDF